VPEIVGHSWQEPGLSRPERVIRFIESLPITAGKLAGQPFKLRPWQKKDIRAIYREKRGKRVVRTAVLSFARKNGKTSLGAACALCHLVGPESVQRGEIYTCANDKLQATKIFDEAVAIIERVPWMADRLSIKAFNKRIEDIGPGGNGSIYATLSAEVATKHGLSPSFWIYDELGQAPNGNLLAVMDSAMGARDEPLGLIISTQAPRDDAALSVLIDYGVRIQNGELKDDSFYMSLYSAPDDADPWDIKTWRMANPALDDFRDLDDVKRMAAQAQRMPSKEADFRNLVLNQRIDSISPFLTASVWKACGDPVDMDSLKGKPCYAGLDLGSSRDMSALVLVFGPDEDGTVDVLPYSWLPHDDLADRADHDRAPYLEWRKAGHLLTSPGLVIDPKTVALKIAELHGLYHIKGLAYDRYRIEDLRRELNAIGCNVELIEHGQGFVSMSPAVDTLERLAFEGKLRHGNNPLLSYAMSGVKLERDAAGNRKPHKARSLGRIDPAVACVMACSAITKAPAPKPPSVYNRRGILTF
jgi:phage terminase large subunit-like protein